MTTRRRAESDGEQTAHVPPRQRLPSDSKRCAWKTQGRQCSLTGGMSPYVGEVIPMYCHWHYLMLQTPDLCEEYREFERWAKGWEVYCAEENHWPLAQVWEAVQGQRDLDPRRRQPCLLEIAGAPRPLPARPLTQTTGDAEQRRLERAEGVRALAEERATLTPFQRETRARLLGLDGRAVSEEVPF